MSKKKNIEQKAVRDDGFCVYIGPTLTGVIQNGTIFSKSRENVLDTLKSVIEKHPLVRTLIVADKTLSMDRIKVKTPGNILYVNYKKLLSGRN